jgi:hypothetical protein
MKRTITVSVAAAALLLASAGAMAQTKGVQSIDRFVKELPIDVVGSLWIDNPSGNIDVAGTELGNVIINVTRTVVGADKEALTEGREQTVVSFEGDPKVRLVRTLLPPQQVGVSPRWKSSVSYSIRVPRSVSVKIGSRSAERIRVAGMTGSLTVNSFNANVILDDNLGVTIVEAVNGRVTFDYKQRPTVRAQVQAVNADVEIYVPRNSDFNWVADSIRGDIITNLPVRGSFSGTSYHGVVNAPGGPTLTAISLMGRVALLARGSRPTDARSVRRSPEIYRNPRTPNESMLLQPAQKIQMPIINGDWIFAASVADVSVGAVRGNARVHTGAGEVEIGEVSGSCTIDSLGGPLTLGEIMGPLLAHTGAGDVLVRSAREGGEISTGGGIIRLLYNGGPTTLHSDGGDIVVRQAAAPITADTRSGDINITVDQSQKTQKIDSRTAQGNIILNLPLRFAADIDATIVTSDATANGVHSEFAGLSIKREQVGGRTRIHATGKFNGGGDRIELYAEEGDIHFTTQVGNPISILKK